MKRATFNLFFYWLAAGGVLVLMLWAAGTSQGAISDCIDATCRITAADGGRGSGCVFEITEGRIYVLTAGHVVERADTVQCEFWAAGHQSIPLPGRVIMRCSAADAAVVALQAGQFAGRLPKAVPLAGRDWIARPGETLTSVGCANGGWSTGWKGHVLGYQGDDLHFLPTPANGRSGSALFDAEGTKIVGVVRARDEQSGEGIATSVQSLYQGFPTRLAASSAERTQCGPGGCPVPQRQGYLLPYRNWQAERDRQRDAQPQQPIWPTLPLAPIPEGAKPPAAPDLGPITQRLDQMTNNESRIIDLLMELRKAPQPPAPPGSWAAPGGVPAEGARPPAASQAISDDKAAKAAEEAKAKAEEAKAGAEKAVSEVKLQSDKLHDALAQVKDLVKQQIGDQGTLLERIEARREKVKSELGPSASEIQIAQAYAKDLAAEKLPTALPLLITIVASALGLGGLGVIGARMAASTLAPALGAAIKGTPNVDIPALHALAQKAHDRIDALLHPAAAPAKPQAAPPAPPAS
jgi:hypothetical protein